VDADETEVVHNPASIRYVLADKSHVKIHGKAQELTVLVFIKKAV